MKYHSSSIEFYFQILRKDQLDVWNADNQETEAEFEFSNWLILD